MTTALASFNSALVGIDFSHGSRQALRAAAYLQREGAVQLAMQHVVDSHGIGELADALSLKQEELVAELQEKGRERMETWSAEAKLESPPTYLSGCGDPTKELLETAEEYDLLVLGERGESQPGRGVGTVAVHCVRRAKRRVLLVNQEGEEVHFDRVVAGIDFSAASSKVLMEAVAMAHLCSASLEVLHVYRAPWDRLHYRAPTAESSPHFRREYLEMLEQQMRDSLTGIDYEPLRTVLHRASSYGYGIADYVRKSHADLVVLGTHGRSTLKELYLGSTAERLLRELPCSVMTVRTG